MLVSLVGLPLFVDLTPARFDVYAGLLVSSLLLAALFAAFALAHSWST
jgi:predicted ABC-type exoprotein transport system permease subunit